MDDIYILIYENYIKSFNNYVSDLLKTKNITLNYSKDKTYFKNLCYAFINNRYKNKTFHLNNLNITEYDNILNKFNNDVLCIVNTGTDKNNLIKSLIDVYYIYITNSVLEKCFI